MDNIKMGTIIREARKKKGYTQKDIATRLNITDRAVSKWERGICAPDLALLEPLAEMLELSITELITGEFNVVVEYKEEVELVVKETIQYSKQEKKNIEKRIIISVLLSIVIILLVVSSMWYHGVFHIIGKYTSPDGNVTTTVYNCLLKHNNNPPIDNGITLSNEGRFEGQSLYQNCEFIELWWSHDSNYKVVSLYNTKYEEPWLVLTDFKRNVTTDLLVRLEESIHQSEFFPEEITKLSFEFMQWSKKDPSVMLIYFNYEDEQGKFHEGYMWYNYESGQSSGEMEINQSTKEIHFLNEFWDNVN